MDLNTSFQNMSLQDIIRVRSNPNIDMSNASLDDYIKAFKLSTVKEDEPPIAEEHSCGIGRNELFEDVQKSLEEIIRERRIEKPSSLSPSKCEGAVINNSPEKAKVKESLPNKIKLRNNVDPCTNSLDDMIVIEKRTEVTPDNRPKKKERKRTPVTRIKRAFEDDRELLEIEFLKDGLEGGLEGHLRPAKHIFTPYQTIGYLSQAGLIIELKIGRLDEVPNATAKAHLWRCEISCGMIRGLSDSLRKVVAREMASVQFLNKLKIAFPESTYPKYIIPNELFIDPRVFHMVEKIGIERALNICHEVRLKPNDPKERSYSTFVCTYFIGSDTIVGESPFQDYAKIRAAKAAYEFLTGAVLIPTKYFVGDDECPSNYDHYFNESEVSNILGLTEEEAQANHITKDETPSPELSGISRGRGRGRGRGVRRKEMSTEPDERVVKKLRLDSLRSSSEPKPSTSSGSSSSLHPCWTANHTRTVRMRSPTPFPGTISDDDF